MGNKNKNIRHEQGFTLIELLVVIAIIGLLASVVLVSLNSARQKSRDAKRLSDINQIAKALELFYNQASAYPTGTGTIGATTNYVCASGGTPGTCSRLLGSAQMIAVNPSGTQVLFTPSFLSGVPASPNPADGGCNSSQNPYMFETNAAGSTYTLTFCLGATTGSYQSGVRTLTPAGIR